jgi:hypothetical protein
LKAAAGTVGWNASIGDAAACAGFDILAMAGAFGRPVLTPKFLRGMQPS